MNDKHSNNFWVCECPPEEGILGRVKPARIDYCAKCGQRVEWSRNATPTEVEMWKILRQIHNLDRKPIIEMLKKGDTWRDVLNLQTGQ